MTSVTIHTPKALLGVTLVFVLSLPAVTTRLYASDEVQFFAYLRSLWFDHDLSFENEYRYFHERGIATGARARERGEGLVGDGFYETFLVMQTPTGRRHNFATIGCALLWSPFYAVADIGVRTARRFGARVPADGFATPYVAAVAYGTAVYGFLALLLAAQAARRVAGDPRVAVAAVWLGTPLIFYMYVAPGMSHGPSAFAVAAFVVTWLRVRSRWSVRGALALGGVGALMGMVREQDLFFILPVAADFLWSWGQAARRDPSAHTRWLPVAGVGVAAFVVAYLPQALAYLTLNGRIGPSEVIGRKMFWSAPHALGVVLSPEHGLFFWTPLALLGVAGLARLALWPAVGPAPPPDRRRLALLLLSMMALQVYISGSVDSWTVAGTFGQRRFVSITALLVVGLAGLWAAGRARWVLGGAIALAVWWNVALAVQFGAGMMNRQRLELSRNAYNAFVVVPRRLPRLAYRYAFDRQSFFAAPGESRRSPVLPATRPGSAPR